MNNSSLRLSNDRAASRLDWPLFYFQVRILNRIPNLKCRSADFGSSSAHYGRTVIFPTPSRYSLAMVKASLIWSRGRVWVSSGANHSA
jgi:hypothetical protein